jgi:hypothetical protein
MTLLNETIFHDERGTYRAKAGGAYNFPMGDGSIRKGDGSGGSGQTFPAAGTIPFAREVEGLTLSTHGVDVRGSADFPTTIKVSDWLYNGGAGGSHEVREIESIEGTLIKLKQAFSVDINASIVLVCARQDLKKIVIENVHATTSALVQEATLGPGKRFVNGGAPVTYNQAGGGTLEFTVHK